jgi:hypothetical protein
VLYNISPKIVYYESNIEIWFDPKDTIKDLIKDIVFDEKHFVNAKIGYNIIDFKNRYDFEKEMNETDYNGYEKNKLTA